MLPTRERGRLSTLTLHSTAQHVASILFNGRHRTVLDDFVVIAVPGADSCTLSEEMLVRVAAQRDRLPGEGCQKRRETIWDLSYRCCFSGPRCFMQLHICPSAGSECSRKGCFRYLGCSGTSLLALTHAKRMHAHALLCWLSQWRAKCTFRC